MASFLFSRPAESRSVDSVAPIVVFPGFVIDTATFVAGAVLTGTDFVVGAANFLSLFAIPGSATFAFGGATGFAGDGFTATLGLDFGAGLPAARDVP